MAFPVYSGFSLSGCREDLRVVAGPSCYEASSTCGLDKDIPISILPDSRRSEHYICMNFIGRLDKERIVGLLTQSLHSNSGACVCWRLGRNPHWRTEPVARGLFRCPAWRKLLLRIFFKHNTVEMLSRIQRSFFMIYLSIETLVYVYVYMQDRN